MKIPELDEFLIEIGMRGLEYENQQARGENFPELPGENAALLEGRRWCREFAVELAVLRLVAMQENDCLPHDYGAAILGFTSRLKSMSEIRKLFEDPRNRYLVELWRTARDSDVANRAEMLQKLFKLFVRLGEHSLI